VWAVFRIGPHEILAQTDGRLALIPRETSGGCRRPATMAPGASLRLCRAAGDCVAALRQHSRGSPSHLVGTSAPVTASLAAQSRSVGWTTGMHVAQPVRRRTTSATPLHHGTAEQSARSGTSHRTEGRRDQLCGGRDDLERRFGADQVHEPMVRDLRVLVDPDSPLRSKTIHVLRLVSPMPHPDVKVRRSTTAEPRS